MTPTKRWRSCRYPRYFRDDEVFAGWTLRVLRARAALLRWSRGACVALLASTALVVAIYAILHLVRLVR
jgi:hypothetical protein